MGDVEQLLRLAGRFLRNQSNQFSIVPDGGRHEPQPGIQSVSLHEALLHRFRPEKNTYPSACITLYINSTEAFSLSILPLC
jgi:hypothetical protein